MTVKTNLDIERAVIVTRATELDELAVRFGTVRQARFYIEQSGHPFEPIVRAHDTYSYAVDAIKKSLPRDLRQHVIERSLVPQYAFSKSDLVIIIGQDGLVSNTAKYLDEQAILAVNPNPALYDGVLLPFSVQTAQENMNRIIDGNSPLRDITLATTSLTDGQTLLAFNDFFIGARTHVSARYTIRHGDREEYHSSSGVIIATGAGSTGWMKSVYTGAAGVIHSLGGHVTPQEMAPSMPWDADYLLFAVREPFPSRVTGTDIVFGKITKEEPLIIQSQMAQNGVIFSDGIEADYLEFNSGADAKISIAPKKVHLIS
mgnify:CR=1 FL=1